MFELNGGASEEEDIFVILVFANGFVGIEWLVDESDDCWELFAKVECEFYIPKEFQGVIYHVHDFPKLTVHVVLPIVGHVAVFKSIRVHVCVCNVLGCLHHRKKNVPVPMMHQKWGILSI